VVGNVILTGFVERRGLVAGTPSRRKEVVEAALYAGRTQLLPAVHVDHSVPLTHRSSLMHYGCSDDDDDGDGVTQGTD